MIATLLDFDGVLVDSEPVHLAAFNDVLAQCGVTISTRDYVDRYLSLDDAGVFRAVLSRGGRTLREEEVRAMVAAKAPRFMSRFETSFRVFPGARELVARRLSRGPVAIVSGALEPEIRYALGALGAADALAFIVSAEQTAASKPDPAPYLLAIERLREAGHKDGAVVVEDSTGGVLAAKRAGLRCIAVTHSSGKSDLEGAGADAVVDHLDAVTDALLEAVV